MNNAFKKLILLSTVLHLSNTLYSGRHSGDLILEDSSPAATGRGSSNFSPEDFRRISGRVNQLTSAFEVSPSSNPDVLTRTKHNDGPINFDLELDKLRRNSEQQQETSRSNGSSCGTNEVSSEDSLMTARSSLSSLGSPSFKKVSSEDIINFTEQLKELSQLTFENQELDRQIADQIEQNAKKLAERKVQREAKAQSLIEAPIQTPKKVTERAAFFEPSPVLHSPKPNIEDLLDPAITEKSSKLTTKESKKARNVARIMAKLQQKALCDEALEATYDQEIANLQAQIAEQERINSENELARKKKQAEWIAQMATANDRVKTLLKMDEKTFAYQELLHNFLLNIKNAQNESSQHRKEIFLMNSFLVMAIICSTELLYQISSNPKDWSESRELENEALFWLDFLQSWISWSKEDNRRLEFVKRLTLKCSTNFIANKFMVEGDCFLPEFFATRLEKNLSNLYQNENCWKFKRWRTARLFSQKEASKMMFKFYEKILSAIDFDLSNDELYKMMVDNFFKDLSTKIKTDNLANVYNKVMRDKNLLPEMSVQFTWNK